MVATFAADASANGGLPGSGWLKGLASEYGRQHAPGRLFGPNEPKPHVVAISGSEVAWILRPPVAPEPLGEGWLLGGGGLVGLVVSPAAGRPAAAVGDRSTSTRRGVLGRRRCLREIRAVGRGSAVRTSRVRRSARRRLVTESLVSPRRETTRALVMRVGVTATTRKVAVVLVCCTGRKDLTAASALDGT